MDISWGCIETCICGKFFKPLCVSAELISIPTNTKFIKAVGYIHDNNSWDRWYVLLNILFPCLIVLFLADINRAGMENIYYYSRTTKKCIEETISDIYYHRLFPEIFSPANMWNKSDDKSDE